MSAPHGPRISVLMPVARIDAHLDAALASIAAQTLRDFELLLVCDEALTGALRARLATQRIDYPARIVCSPLRGLAFALNLGIAVASGEFIARWDADDLCDARRFARQVETFEQRPALAVLGTRAVLIDAQGQELDAPRFRYYGGDRAIRRALRYRQALVHSSVMFRRAVLLEHGGYRYGYACEDHALYLRLAREPGLEFANLDDVVTRYRRHPGQRTTPAAMYEHFCEIAGFMMIEFLRFGHPSYLVGMAANLPLARRFRQGWRRVRGAASRRGLGGVAS